MAVIHAKYDAVPYLSILVHLKVTLLQNLDEYKVFASHGGGGVFLMPPPHSYVHDQTIFYP